MADSDALRQRRRRLHAAGDHSLCRRCAALRGEDPPVLAVVPAAEDVPALDPRSELEALARRLTAAHRSEPENAIVARELRLTLESLARMGPAVADPMEELRAIVAGVS